MTEKIHLPVDMLQNFMRDVFIAAGVPSSDAEIASDILITSDLRGIESHGIGRLRMYYDRIKGGQIIPITKMDVVRETPTTAVIDGNHGLGMVIAYRSMQKAIEKARTFGMGAVAVRNSTHFGIDGYYPLMAIKAGMMGMSFTNARPSINPTFGVQPKLGTNPIAFGCPTDEECPFMFDAATSIIQRGKIEVLDREEKPGKPGWVIDNQGNYLTDCGQILKDLTLDKAALLPLGGAGEDTSGYKGYGLATMVEIFSSALQTGAFLQALSGVDENGKSRYHRVGHFFMAISIDAFVELNTFKKSTGEMLRELRNSTKAPGAKRIYTAGEKEFESEKAVRTSGVRIVPNLQKDMLYLQKELKLSQYKLPF